MLERQEIDALLISALYGELSPTEEARLSAHLDTHPADKSALADLTSTRDQVRESRLLQVQLEPPQSVSALLLQEAHRRAPKAAGADGWFARLARSFMAHPAMAAAAMLVIVLGIATLVRNKTGDEMDTRYADDTSVAQPAAPAASAGSAAATPPNESPSFGATERERQDQETAGVAAGSGAGSDAFKVGLAENTRTLNDGDAIAKQDKGGGDSANATPTVTAAVTKSPDTARRVDQQAQKGKDAPADVKKAPAKASGAMELRSADPTPKDFEAYDGIDNARPAKEQVNAITPATPTNGVAGMGGGGAAGNGAPGRGAYAVPPPATGSAGPSGGTNDYRKADTTQPPAQPSAPAAAPGAATTAPQGAPSRQQTPARNAPTPPPPPPPPPAKAEKVAEKPRAAAPAEDRAAPNDPQLAWARQQHEAIVAKADAKNCTGAAVLALDLANRDRAYYQTNVVTDRRLKGCITYITGSVDRESERAEKQRAAQKRNEPAPAAIDSTK